MRDKSNYFYVTVMTLEKGHKEKPKATVRV